MALFLILLVTTLIGFGQRWRSMKVGDIWRWTRNHIDHPNEPEYNYFVVLDMDWGIHVMYLMDGKHTTYTADTYAVHNQYLELVA